MRGVVLCLAFLATTLARAFHILGSDFVFRIQHSTLCIPKNFIWTWTITRKWLHDDCINVFSSWRKKYVCESKLETPIVYLFYNHFVFTCDIKLEIWSAILVVGDAKRNGKGNNCNYGCFIIMFEWFLELITLYLPVATHYIEVNIYCFWLCFQQVRLAIFNLVTVVTFSVDFVWLDMQSSSPGCYLWYYLYVISQ